MITDEKAQQLLQALFRQDDCPKIVAFAAGGGTRFINWLLLTPGASNCVLEIKIPYCYASSREILNWHADAEAETPHQVVSEEASGRLADVALERCARLAYQEGVPPPHGIPTLHATTVALSEGEKRFLSNPTRVDGEKEGLCPNIDHLHSWPIKQKCHPCKRLMGIGCTAALATSRDRKGEDRFFVSVRTYFGAAECSGKLNRLSTSREEQDRIVSDVLLKYLVGFALNPKPSLGLVLDEFNFVQTGGWVSPSEQTDEVEKYLNGKATHAIYWAGNYTDSNSSSDAHCRLHIDPPINLLCHPWHMTKKAIECFPPCLIVFPGSFNPLHSGHLSLMRDAMEAAYKLFNDPLNRCPESRVDASVKYPQLCVFELSCVNADKGCIDASEVMRRLKQFDLREERLNVLLTCAPRFIDKARLFRSIGIKPIFVLGYDTYERLLNKRFYTSSTDLREAMEYFRDSGVQFLVAGRSVSMAGEEIYKTISTHKVRDESSESCVQIANDFSDLFTEIENFNKNISSTALRDLESASNIGAA